MLTPEQSQAARGLLQWTRERLASEAGVNVQSVIEFELEQVRVAPAITAALTGALEAAGIDWADLDSGPK